MKQKNILCEYILLETRYFLIPE